jgi:hypothetical protein
MLGDGQWLRSCGSIDVSFGDTTACVGESLATRCIQSGGGEDLVGPGGVGVIRCDQQLGRELIRGELVRTAAGRDLPGLGILERGRTS